MVKLFEDISYEYLLSRMLKRVPNNIDKREGSIIYDALAPAAVELQRMYIALDSILLETFADTATHDFLVLRARERGINVMPATNVILRGEFNMDIPIGSRFSLRDYTYEAIERLDFGVFKMRCETPGANANMYLGTLIPISYINGLTRAELVDVLVPGQDEESTEHLRQRYFESLNSVAFGGNIADYIQKTTSIAGVGAVKVYPVWNGGGTVRLVIINSDYKKPSAVLIDDVQTAIDPEQNQGTGLGLAPIGHVVTVHGVNEKLIDIKANFTFQVGWTWDMVKPSAETAVDSYFKELAQDWADEELLVVRISQLETRFLNLSGVIDVGGTKVNGGTVNFTLEPDEIPIRGVVASV